VTEPTDGGLALLQSAFMNPEMAANPFPMYQMMRGMGSVMQIPMSFGGGTGWVVSRFEEAVQVLKDNQHFTVDASLIDSTRGVFGQAMAAANPGANFLNNRTMVSVDEPDHTRLRGLVSKAFTPRFIESLRPHIQEIADELLDRVQDAHRMDVVTDFGYPLPINVISDMLGVPKDQRAKISEWSQSLTGGNFQGGADGGREQSSRMFSNYVAELVAEKRKHPGDDLISKLIEEEATGDHLDETELLSMVGILIFAGHETTSNLIDIGTLMLLDHPDQLEMLKATPSLIPSAIEELLRFNGPVTMPAPRFVLQDTELGGQQLHRGDMIIVMVASANRDEQQFSDPEELNIARDLNRHIAFGQGIHYCLGAPLARMEGEIAFSTLLRRMPDLHFAVPREEITWRNNMALRGLLSLPVAF